MFDIAINGMGLVGGDSFTFQNLDYSHFNPFNKPEFYHPYCPIDFANDTSCEIVGPLFLIVTDGSSVPCFLASLFMPAIGK